MNYIIKRCVIQWKKVYKSEEVKDRGRLEQMYFVPNHSVSEIIVELLLAIIIPSR